jgi:TetR/AcrR family transcriptional repressor of mexJK operon
MSFHVHWTAILLQIARRMTARVSETDKSVDPRVVRSRKAILTAASEHFLRDGYVSANVDAMAELARVSKRTVYNIFGSKEQLFRELMADALATAEAFAMETSATLEGATELEPSLREVAARLAGTVLEPGILSLRRLLISEAERFPDVARDYYERAPGRVLKMLAQALRRFTERGLLSATQPRIAAEHFAFLVMGAPLDRALFSDSKGLPSQRELDKQVAAGVTAFLRAYAPGHVERR